MKIVKAQLIDYVMLIIYRKPVRYTYIARYLSLKNIYPLLNDISIHYNALLLWQISFNI